MVVGILNTLAALASATTLFFSIWRSMDCTPNAICGWWSMKMICEFCGVRTSSFALVMVDLLRCCRRHYIAGMAEGALRKCSEKLRCVRRRHPGETQFGGRSYAIRHAASSQRKERRGSIALAAVSSKLLARGLRTGPCAGLLLRRHGCRRPGLHLGPVLEVDRRIEDHLVALLD